MIYVKISISVAFLYDQHAKSSAQLIICTDAFAVCLFHFVQLQHSIEFNVRAGDISIRIHVVTVSVLFFFGMII